MRYHIEYQTKFENNVEDYDSWTIIESDVECPVNEIDYVEKDIYYEVGSIYLIDIEEETLPKAFNSGYELIMKYIEDNKENCQEDL